MKKKMIIQSLNNTFTLLVFITVTFLIFTKTSHSQAGQLDSTFGQGGRVSTAINVIGTSEAWSAAIQSDGKIVTAGYSNNGSKIDFALTRHNPNGSPDISFGLNGVVITGIGSATDEAFSLAIQNDGKIVAAGRSFNGSDFDFALVRYNQNGSLDNTFGSNGIVVTQVGPSNDHALSLAIQNDGKIIAAGYSHNGSNNDFTVVRYNTNGFLDNSFGIGGKVITPVGASNDLAYSVAIRSDGKIIAAGMAFNGSNFDFALVRYNSNGALDNAFGVNGIVITPIGAGNDEAYSVAIKNDGKIIVGGYSHNGSNSDFALVCYNSNGSQDSSFGTDGIITISAGPGNDYILSVAIQFAGSEEQKIIAAGYSHNGSNNDFAVARFNQDGSPDNTFGTNGIVTTQIGLINDYALSVVIQPAGDGDEKIIAAGYSSNGSFNNFTLVRYNSDGNLDNDFGINGIATTSIGKTLNWANSVVIQSDEKILAAGYSRSGSDYDFALVRYNSNGLLDDTFGTNGIVTTAIGAGNDEAYSLAIQSNGKIIAAGVSYNVSDYDFAIVRYNSNGTLDNTFGTNGTVTTPIAAGDDIVNSVAIQNDGKIVASGYSHNGSNNDFAVVRYNTNGTLDNTFGTNGIVTTPIGAGTDIVRSIAIQNDGKIVAAGYSHNGSNNDIAVVRYNPNGALDNSFGINGILITPIGPSSDIARSVTIQSDGKIIAAGSSNNGSNNDIILVRYHPNGILDNTFGINGIVTTDLGANEVANSAALKNNGKIIAAGSSNSLNDYDFALVQYNSDGSLDNTFGTGGIVMTPFGIATDEAMSVAVQDDGRIVAAGGSLFGSPFNSVFSLARYDGGPLTGIDEENDLQIPVSFILEQNYPNPFNPSTSIEYKVGSSEYVTLKIYDVLGNEVVTLVNEEKVAGSYKVIFDAVEFSSGVYFYKLKAGDIIETKKMILLR